VLQVWLGYFYVFWPVEHEYDLRIAPSPYSLLEIAKNDAKNQENRENGIKSEIDFRNKFCA